MASDIAMADGFGMERSRGATPLTGFGRNDEISLGGDFSQPRAWVCSSGWESVGGFSSTFTFKLAYKNVSFLGSGDACNGIEPGVTG